MDCDARLDPEELLTAARAGRGDGLGRLLQLHWNYLKLLASTQLDEHLRTRLDPSDVVQETLLDAHRDFGEFCGTTEAEFLAWLRRILLNNLLRLVEQHLLAECRDVRREVSLERLRESLEQSSLRVEKSLGGLSSPSGHAQRREQAATLANQLAKLPDQYREVLVLRHLQSLSFDEVARRMERSAGAVRMLWLRAIDQLRRLLEAEGLK
jgi:RNA polymerase sigma-70 factor, ECF subfamily